MNMNDIHEAVKRQLSRASAGVPSLVPEGQEDKYPRLVFEEQLQAAVAAKMGVDLSSLQSMEQD